MQHKSPSAYADGMGYTLEGLLLDRAAAKAQRRLRGISLPQGITLVPLTDEMVDALPGLAGNASIGGKFWKLNAAIEALARELSGHGRVAYVEVNYFGGSGTQDSAVWQGGNVVAGPTHTDGRGAVNEALRALGVDKGQAPDEFEVIDLGQCRSTADWLERES